MPPIDRFDRAAHLRRDPAFLDAARAAAGTVLVPVWRGKGLVTTTAPRRAVLPRVAEAGHLLDAAEELAFLGLAGEDAVLLVDLPRDREPEVPIGAFQDLRLAGSELPDDEMALLAYARGLAHWHRSARFDGRTGRPTRAVDGGFARAVDGDAEGGKTFPRLDPAVMVLVTLGDRCLLARQPGWPPGMYSALAGFVEPGETLEACVVRETREEVGLDVRAVRYTRSQPWPFPASLMIGFRAEATSTDFRLDDDELEAAMWVDRAALRRPAGFFVPPRVSLAWRMLQDFLDEEDPAPTAR